MVDAAYDNNNGVSLECDSRSAYTRLSSTVAAYSSNENSEVVLPSNGVSLSVLVHFKYGASEFARKIKIVEFIGFYKNILSILENKIPGHIPQDLQFLCGKKWYTLNEDTDLDSLCLDDKDAEMSIQATPIKLGKHIVCMSK